MDKISSNILFVCYGNMCRSPMAEGLAKTILDGKADVESAGISPCINRATAEAIDVMQKEFGIDISGHRPRSVTDIELDRFDSIIALDSYVYARLKEDHRIDSGRLIQWDIDDPYGASIDVYRECVFNIRRSVQKLRLVI